MDWNTGTLEPDVFKFPLLLLSVACLPAAPKSVCGADGDSWVSLGFLWGGWGDCCGAESPVRGRGRGPPRYARTGQLLRNPLPKSWISPLEAPTEQICLRSWSQGEDEGRGGRGCVCEVCE